MQEILIPSSVDSSLQPSLFFHPSPGKNVPLVVGLHTWSFDRFNQQNTYLPLCQQYGWALLLPEFRGPNLQSNPIAKLACGSTTARQDIFDAIRAVCADCGRGGFVETADLKSNAQEGIEHPLGWYDDIHFSRRSIYELGKRYFAAYTRIVNA